MRGGTEGGVAIEFMVSNALTLVLDVSEGVGHMEVWLYSSWSAMLSPKCIV